MAVDKITIRVEFEDGGGAEQTLYLTQHQVERMQYWYGGVLKAVTQAVKSVLDK